MQSVPDSQNAGSISHAQCPSGLRRRLIAAAAAVTFSGLAVFGPAFAAAEAPLIGVVQLVDHEALNDSVRGITDGLKARGLAGSLDLQNAHGDQSTLKTIGDRFVHKDAKLIFAVATPAVQAMARATKTIPIVGAAVTSYTAAKVIASNEHPGGNVTGVSNIGPVAAQLDLFMKLVPNAKRVGTIYNAGEINSVVQIELLRAAAEQRGIELEEATVTNLTDLQSAVVSMSKKKSRRLCLSDRQRCGRRHGGCFAHDGAGSSGHRIGGYGVTCRRLHGGDDGGLLQARASGSSARRRYS